jgi:hypothetical protein
MSQISTCRGSICRSLRAAAIAIAGVAAVASATLAADARIGIGERYIDENGQEQMRVMTVEEFMAVTAAPQFFEIRPSVRFLSPGNNVEEENDVAFACVNAFTGQLILFCDVTVTLEDVIDDGGHDHVDPAFPRPLGEFDPPTGNSGADGFFQTTYKAPEVSGSVLFRVVGVDTIGGAFIAPLELSILVRVPNLVNLPPSPIYDLIGDVPGVHIFNHFGTAVMNAKVTKMAAEFAAKFPGRKLELNDISLPLGRIFDVCARAGDCSIGQKAWQFPHRTHRFGDNIDVRSFTVSATEKVELFKITKRLKLSLLVENNPPHFHLTFLGTLPP